MGLFDDLGGTQGIGLGLAGAGGAMERGAAALQGRLPQYDEAQVDIATKKASLFKGILTEIEDLALSSIDDPNIIGPKLKQFQAIAKQAGINLDDKLIDHFTNNPMSLGMTFDPELTKGMTPQQTQILKRLQVESTRPGPRQMQAITKLDEIRATRMTQAVQDQVKELRAADPSLGVKEAYIEAMKGKSYTTSPKLMADALKMMQGSDLELAEVMKTEKAQRSPSVGIDREALAQERGFKDFNSAPQNIKAEINKDVKMREDMRIGLSAGREDRLDKQFQQTMSLNEQRNAEQEAQRRRLLPSQQKILTGNRTAIKTIDDYAKAYDEFAAESKGGAMSDIMRGGIAKNKNAQRAVDLLPIEGRTDAEKKLAAQYNAMIGSVKQLTDEVGVLTDADVPRIMGSFDPAVERSQFKANIAARRKMHQRAFDTALEDYSDMGKDVSRFVERAGGNAPGSSVPAFNVTPQPGPAPSKEFKNILNKAESKIYHIPADTPGEVMIKIQEAWQAAAKGSAAKPPAVGEVRKGYKFKGGDPSKPTSWEKVQ